VRRLLLIPLVLAAISVAVPASPGTAAPSGADATASVCKWKWKKKRVVKWVRKAGKKKRVVRVKKVKVCVPVPPPAPARLGVKAREFGFTLSAKTIRSGDTIVELNNQGEDAHDLHVQRVGGGQEYATPETIPGGIERLRFDTAPGSYRLWCSLPNHATWGMDTTFEAAD
jgi:plastocyanin